MSIHSFEGVLREHPFFAGLDDEHLALLAGCASNVVFHPGEFLFREGQDANQFFVLREGRVAVETFPPIGRPITIETMDGGEVLGWSWAFPPYKWHFDARAVIAVRALALDGACLRAKFDRQPTFGLEMLRRFSQVLVQRLEATQLQLLDMYVGRP